MFLSNPTTKLSCKFCGLLLLFFITNRGFSTHGLNACDLSRIKHTFQTIEQILSKQTTLPSHPWEINFRTALLTHESRNQGLFVDPNISTGNADNPSYFFPVTKEEPVVDKAVLFGHASIEEGKRFSFYPNKGASERSLKEIYPHPYPHPAVMDYYRGLALKLLRASYKDQSLPWKAWQTIQMDEFALANHRSFEVVISHKLAFRAYARLYLGSRNLGSESQLFGDRQPKTKLYSLGVPAGEVSVETTPIERLLKRFGIRENPIEDLRQQFPDHRIVEVGRLLVPSAIPVEERKAAKRLLFSAVCEILQEVSPDRDLSKVIFVASSGPFGMRRYPRDFGMQKILQTTLKAENLVEDIPEGVGTIGEATLQIRWVDELKEVFNEQNAEDPRDLTVFAVTGDVLKKTLIANGSIFTNFPETDRFPYMKYDSMMDSKL